MANARTHTLLNMGRWSMKWVLMVDVPLHIIIKALDTLSQGRRKSHQTQPTHPLFRPLPVYPLLFLSFVPYAPLLPSPTPAFGSDANLIRPHKRTKKTGPEIWRTWQLFPTHFPTFFILYYHYRCVWTVVHCFRPLPSLASSWCCELTHLSSHPGLRRNFSFILFLVFLPRPLVLFCSLGNYPCCHHEKVTVMKKLIQSSQAQHLGNLGRARKEEQLWRERKWFWLERKAQEVRER